mgnify:CR=1 FL=1
MPKGEIKHIDSGNQKSFATSIPPEEDSFESFQDEIRVETQPSVKEERSDELSERNFGMVYIHYASSREDLHLIRRRLGHYGKMLLNYIREGKDIREIIKRFDYPLRYDIVRFLAEEAIRYRNLAALTALAETNAIVVARVIEEYITELNHFDDISLIHLYFLVKSEMSKEKERIFRKIVNHVILRKTMGIIGRKNVKSGVIRKRVEYRPSLDFDLEGTLERSLDKILAQKITMKDIIGIERRDKRTAGVLIIDFSGSMFGEKNVLASLVSALVSYSLSRNDQYSIVIFNDDAYVIKGMTEKKSIKEILEILFDLKPLGFTDISKALKISAKELKKSKIKTRKWAILITDGEYNRGDDPLKYANMFPKLHVVQLGGGVLGTYVCRSLAKGRGKYIRVSSINDLLRAVRWLLKYPDR